MASKIVALIFVSYICLSLAAETGQNDKKCFVPTEAGRLQQIIRRLNKAEDKQTQSTLDLVVETTRLTELEKIRDAEKISDSTQTNQLTYLQKRILSDIAKTKAEKEDLNVDVAVANTLIDQLKMLLVANGGSTDTYSTNKVIINKKKLESKIKHVQERLERINAELVSVTKQLEELESKKTAQNINTDNGAADLNRAQRVLLWQLERTKSRKYELAIQSAITSAMIQYFQLQLNELTSSNTGTNPSNTPANTGTSSTDTGNQQANTGTEATNTSNPQANTDTDSNNTSNPSENTSADNSN